MRDKRLVDGVLAHFAIANRETLEFLLANPLGWDPGQYESYWPDEIAYDAVTGMNRLMGEQEYEEYKKARAERNRLDREKHPGMYALYDRMVESIFATPVFDSKPIKVVLYDEGAGDG